MSVLRKLLAAFLIVVLPAAAFAVGGVSPPDPYQLRAAGVNDNFQGLSWKVTAGLAPRNNPINPSLKTLILFMAGQSNGTNVLPTQYVPTNSTVVDQFNIYDGSLYSINDSLIGCSGRTGSVTLSGSVLARISDKAIPTFDRVILVCLAIGSTRYADWATGEESNRVAVAAARLALRGITPTTTGTTWALIMMDGEDDNSFGTSPASLAASFATFKANTLAAVPTMKIFQPQESYNGVTTGADVRAMQAAVVDNVSVFGAGDNDSFTGTPNRQAGNAVHLDDTGGANVATQTWTAMALHIP